MASRPAYLAIALLTALTGCKTIGDNSDPVVGRYVGFVQVRAPSPNESVAPGVRQTQVHTLGGWLELSPRDGGVESVGAGWRSSKRLIVPSDCRLVIIVRSEAEMASVRTLLRTEAIAKGETCLIKDSP